MTVRDPNGLGGNVSASAGPAPGVARLRLRSVQGPPPPSRTLTPTRLLSVAHRHEGLSGFVSHKQVRVAIALRDAAPGSGGLLRAPPQRGLPGRPGPRPGPPRPRHLVVKYHGIFWHRRGIFLPTRQAPRRIRISIYHFSAKHEEPRE